MKRITAILALTLVLTMSAHAQIWIMEGDEEENLRVSSDVNGEWNNVIFHGSTDDQMNHSPLGSGMLVMTVLGGLFLMNKRKNESK